MSYGTDINKKINYSKPMTIIQKIESDNLMENLDYMNPTNVKPGVEAQRNKRQLIY